MKNMLRIMLLSHLTILCASTAIAGNMWGSQNRPLLSDGDAKIDNMYDNSNITLMDGGEIGSMAGNSFVDTMNDGYIDIMQGNASSHVGIMNGGTIGTIQNYSYVQTLNDGTINWLRQRTYVDTMNGGTITRIGDDVIYGNAAHVKNMTNGEVGSITGSGYVQNMSGGKIINVNTSGVFATQSGGTITDFINGTITNMNSSAKVTNLKGGTISNMTGSAEVNSMTGGIIDSVNSATAKVNNLSGGHINYLYNGVVGDVSGSAYISDMLGGSVNELAGNSYVTNMSNNSHIENVIGNAKVTNMNGGTINIVNTTGTFSTQSGGTITDLINGTIINMNSSAKVTNLKGGTISNMTGNAEVNSMTGGIINSVNSATAKVNNLSGGHIDYLNNGVVGDVSGSAYISNMLGGSVNELAGNSYVEHMNGGIINIVNTTGTLSSVTYGTINTFDNGNINNMSGGTIINFNNGNISNMYGGNIGTMANGTSIGSIRGNSTITIMDGGTIGTMDKTSFITTMNNGTIDTIQNASYWGNVGIGTMNDGLVKNLVHNATINIMNGGTIENVNNVATIGEVNGGLIEYVNGPDKSDGTFKIGKFNDGKIVEIYNGTVDAMNGGEIDNLVGITKVNVMSDGLVSNLGGAARIEQIKKGVVNSMTSGYIGEIQANGEVNNIKSGTIFGDVANGKTITAVNGGAIYFKAETPGKTLDRAVVAGASSHIELRDYTLGANSSFDMGNNSRIIADSVDAAKINYRGNGTFELSNYGQGGFINTTIQDFSAAGNVTFEMNVDEAIGGSNDSLKIVSNTGSQNNHYLAIGSEHTSQNNRDVIDIVHDQSGTMSFKLHGGNYVGLGALNYYLSSSTLVNEKLWSLRLAGTLSDQALVIGSVASANLSSVYAVQSSLHQRMGDIRSQLKEGVWARTYTNQSGFKDLASTNVANYGVEGGADKKVANLGNGKLSIGFGIGVAYADTDVKTYNSKDGEADTIMPYAGLYATWSNCDGFYVDATAKYIYNDTNGHYYDGADHEKDFNVNTHIGNVSLEGGYQYKVTNNFILEPRAQLSYSYIKGDKFLDSAGYRGEYEDTQSLLGTLGVIARYDYSENVQYYTKVSVLHEFDGESEIVYDNMKYRSDLSGTRGEIGLGFMMSVLENANLYAEAVYQAGDNSYHSINGNLGLYWRF